ncbi:dihydropteroate synthase [Hyphomicrobium sulfonivorans]|uniref:dihydropteroate synthase n=1 Tax=Hyphomicrobium sulfonivorans TaxID=121290 RepID=UPI00156EF749|nr:dihydropteroate synthase [Hyphomicrobium sulfonivorans]MBI1649972.1 dihydropteroate synthase [Hyphomicrobium sulfonivorans]NSL72891.1 dihydropteroate synthase [Hyphomicrobium sulfonivorans]
MQRATYLKPIGLFPAPADPIEEGFAGLPLAGQALSFTTVELAERDGTHITRRIVTLGDAIERDWGRATLLAAQDLEAITAPRPRLAGLALDRPRIMGIVNVTPDSFSDGGLHDQAEAAIAHALQLAEEGADILDVGGESTRPGAAYVPVEDELARVIPVIEGLRKRTDKLISIDTRKAEVMRQAAAAGADILNDVSALSHDPDAMRIAAATGLPVILMHAQGDPRTMNDNPQYDDVVLDVFDYLEGRVAACEEAGIPRARLIVDPGIGFGKHLHHNVALMASLALYHALGVPILLGASRKKLIDHICDVPNPRDRVPGSIAAALAGAAQGVQIVRVHDVAATYQALNVWRASIAGTAEALR